MSLLKNRILLALVMILTTFHGFCQDESVEVRDLETWTSIGLKYKVNKKWTLDLEQQLRLGNNSSEIDSYFTEAGIAYEAFNNFELGLGLRRIRENDNTGDVQGYETHFRYHLDASYKYKINDLSLKHRVRYQSKNELGVSEAEGDYPKKKLRFKTTVRYNIRNWKFDPKVSGEIFRSSEEGEESTFSNYRLTIGTEYKIKKVGEIGLFYRMEKELNVEYPKITNIIGLKFTHKI